jgi:hypothetical protein
LEKIEIILTNCIQDIKSGKAILTECLERYYSRREELEPLLRMALNIQEPPEFRLDSSDKQTMKNHLMSQIRDAKQKSATSFTDILSLGISPQLKWARAVVSIIVVVILMSMMAGGTAYASQDSLPGELLYPVKTGIENARILIADGESAKARLSLNYAQTRLEEINQLIEDNPEKIGLALEGYNHTIDTASRHIQQIMNTAEQTNLLIEASEQLQNQLAFCDGVIDDNPSFSEMVNQASNVSINQQIQILERVSQRDILKAAQVNLEAMNNRIQRAQEKANRNQYQTMQQALLQYQEFYHLGEQILQTAQQSNNHTAEIEILSAQALSSYLEKLEIISQGVPQQYRESVETCTQMTRQLEIQARHRNQEQVNPDSGPGSGAGEPESGAGEPGSGPGEPGDGTGEPGSGPGEPGGGTGEPGSGPGEPGGGTGEPGSGAKEPGSGTGEPGNRSGVPGQ